jgi:hypothetical protein
MADRETTFAWFVRALRTHHVSLQRFMKSRLGVYVFGRIRLLVQNTLARLAVRTSSLRCGSATNVAQIVIGGTKRLSPEGALSMPAFGHAYSDDEIAAVANYVTARFGANGSSLTARDVAVLRAQVSN